MVVYGKNQMEYANKLCGRHAKCLVLNIALNINSNHLVSKAMTKIVTFQCMRHNRKARLYGAFTECEKATNSFAISVRRPA